MRGLLGRDCRRPRAPPGPNTAMAAAKSQPDSAVAKRPHALLTPETVEPPEMSTLASPTRSLPRWFTLPQILAAREHSVRLVAAQGHAVIVQRWPRDRPFTSTQGRYGNPEVGDPRASSERR